VFSEEKREVREKGEDNRRRGEGVGEVARE
jgi:hypothetical protein